MILIIILRTVLHPYPKLQWRPIESGVPGKSGLDDNIHAQHCIKTQVTCIKSIMQCPHRCAWWVVLWHGSPLTGIRWQVAWPNTTHYWHHIQHSRMYALCYVTWDKYLVSHALVAQHGPKFFRIHFFHVNYRQMAGLNFVQQIWCQCWKLSKKVIVDQMPCTSWSNLT